MPTRPRATVPHRESEVRAIRSAVPLARALATRGPLRQAAGEEPAQVCDGPALRRRSDAQPPVHGEHAAAQLHLERRVEPGLRPAVPEQVLLHAAGVADGVGRGEVHGGRRRQRRGVEPVLRPPKLAPQAVLYGRVGGDGDPLQPVEPGCWAEGGDLQRRRRSVGVREATRSWRRLVSEPGSL